MTLEAFTKRWDHTLKIKHLFMDADDDPPVSEIDKMAAGVAEAIRTLQKRIPDTDSLWHDLDNAAEEFEDAIGYEAGDEYDAKRHFNSALNSLYDAADFNKRVWID